jgi:rubrerythrin
VRRRLEINQDQLRRDLRAAEDEHRRSLRPAEDVLSRLFDDSAVPSSAKADVVLGGLHRRRFLRVGGLGVAAAAVLAACGGDDKKSAAATTTTTVAGGGVVPGDITILRTASSLEHVAIDAYTAAGKSGLLTTPAVAAAATLFLTQHQAHAKLFEALTKKLGGEPFVVANPAVTAQLAPQLAALKTEHDVVTLAYGLEKAAAATYQASVGTFGDHTFNEAIMSIGGVEARHAAILASVLGQPPAPSAFSSPDGAVPPGTGLPT